MTDLCDFCKKPVDSAKGDRVEMFAKFHIPPCPERSRYLRGERYKLIRADTTPAEAREKRRNRRKHA